MCRCVICFLPLVFLSVALVSVGVAQSPDTLWMRTYDYERFEQAYSVKQTADGGYIVSGITQTTADRGFYDMHAVRTDENGDTLWTWSSGSCYNEWGGEVEQTPDGGFLFMGSGCHNTLVIRTDASGDTLWSRTYGEGGGYTFTLTSDGGFVVAGGDWYGLYVLKANSDGNLLWLKRYKVRCQTRSISETSDRGFILAAYSLQKDYPTIDFFLMKVDEEGDSIWARTIDTGVEDDAKDIRETSDGGYIAVGCRGEAYPGHQDIYMVRTDSNGDTLWTRTYVSSAGGEGHSVREMSDGGYLVGGHTGRFIGPIGFTSIDYMNVYLMRTDSDGDTVWTREYGGPGRDGGYAMELTEDGGCVIAGFTESFGLYGSGFYLLKTEPILSDPPVIRKVSDIPDDQGRQVRVSWLASSHDHPGDSSTIEGYSIWRKIGVVEQSIPQETVRRGLPRLAYPPGDWDYIVTVPARCEDAYNCVVPTLCDSTALGVCWSTFFVSAMTSDPSVYFDSSPDSGYSVDNLAPPAPENLRFLSPAVLSWDECQEADFNHFSVYGSGSSAFDLSATLIECTFGTSCDVTEEIYEYYHLTASDLAGNEGEPSTIAAAAGVSGYALLQNRPNPFGTKTDIRFHLPQQTQVTLSVFSVKGRLVKTLAQNTFPGGRHVVRWAGDDNRGDPLGSGIYFIRMDAGNFSDNRKMILLR